ncbi:MAG: hypothetical protein ACEY3E_03370 [Candidatus Tisiphia sp.]|uniref:hypothetical protein n=1 Tax=Rickettsieae TaxID=33988 RepID=UPI001E7734B9|nr:MAG: hypothetical protein LF884_07440 [Rickettsia endosymbiont of Cimex lectularius]
MAAKRLLVSLDEKIFDEIAGLAKINNESLSKVAKDLIITSLELQEDKILAKLADERIGNTREWISHTDTWK